MIMKGVRNLICIGSRYLVGTTLSTAVLAAVTRTSAMDGARVHLQPQPSPGTGPEFGKPVLSESRFKVRLAKLSHTHILLGREARCSAHGLWSQMGRV